ncbi:MAG: hypothetical protein H0U76_12230 [Ktedonobacteraceae bacterium]|nr:hypothetical protein [Ktedonobacteraceae bacterium]MBA3825420.1 hypothetical protein [Ktedonobacterales bacterium]
MPDVVLSPTTASACSKATVACLEVWLYLTDDAQSLAYLAEHAALLCTPTAQAIMQRWIVAAPPELATTWRARLMLLAPVPISA